LRETVRTEGLRRPSAGLREFPFKTAHPCAGISPASWGGRCELSGRIRRHSVNELQDRCAGRVSPAGGGGHAEPRGRGSIPAGTFAVQGESPRAEVDTRPEHANLAPSPVIRTGTRCRAADGAWNRSPFLCGLKQRDCLAEAVLLQ